jgi:hypothetical protein
MLQEWCEERVRCPRQWAQAVRTGDGVRMCGVVWCGLMCRVSVSECVSVCVCVEERERECRKVSCRRRTRKTRRRIKCTTTASESVWRVGLAFRGQESNKW